MKKDLFISSVPIIEVEGNKNIPTMLLYQNNGNILIGNEALSVADNLQDVNQNFKVDLGNVIPEKSALFQKFTTATGEKKSAAALSNDFIKKLLKYAETWIQDNNLPKAQNIMIAEPIALQSDIVNSDWLANYRKNIRDGLRVLGFDKDRIDFLPEPFAVFQYYKYGLKHPLANVEKRQCILVIDFGGGTFDTSIIETTNDGDIKKGSKNSKPLGANSIPYGGFYINQMIAQDLLTKYVDKFERHKISKAIDLYYKWRKGANDINDYSKDKQIFINNFMSLIFRLENVKIALCKQIFDWSLDGSTEIKVPIGIPSDPFVNNSSPRNIFYSTNELKDLFINKVWNPHLKQAIKETINRSRRDLEGQPISLILLSGGSSNIKWIEKLIQRDFVSELEKAQVISIEDFQEVVAKGLAIECARRFHTPDGDFAATTYNTLCLILTSDIIGMEPRAFKSLNKDIKSSDTPGVLLPSASALSKFIDEKLTWKVKLEKSPKHHLDYYFLRSTMDPNDINNLQNIIEKTVFTPNNSAFDSHLQIQLRISEDSTVYPRFIYKSGRTEQESFFTDGRPFYLDMTLAKAQQSSDSYLGIDFGTTNSSVTYIDKRTIKTYDNRIKDISWKDVTELSQNLPYPMAAPLAQYLAYPDMSKSLEYTQKFIEAALALSSYIAYMEYCSIKKHSESKEFKGFSQMSAGPLWKFLQSCLNQLGSNAKLSKPLKQMLKLEAFEKIDSAVDFIAALKHGKASIDSFDSLQTIRIIANICNQVFNENIFGFFENIKKKRFSDMYLGYFRKIHGNPPFYMIYNYEGKQSFEDYETFIINLETKKAIPLKPLIFWDNCEEHHNNELAHCYLFDIHNSREYDSFTFKAVGYSCTCSADFNNKYESLAKMLNEMKCKDQNINTIVLDNLFENNNILY